MAERRLPSPDIFASCPYDGKILEYYSGTFEAVLVVLHPFIKPASIGSERFATASYPGRSEILSHCIPVSWAEVASKAGLPSIAAVDIGLRTMIGGLKAEFSNREFANKIELLESDEIVPPSEGCFADLLHDKIFRLFKVSAMSGFGSVMSSAPNESSTGSRTSRGKMARPPQVTATSSHRTKRFSGRLTGIATSPFFALQNAISMLSRLRTNLRGSSVHRSQRFIGVSRPKLSRTRRFILNDS